MEFTIRLKDRVEWKLGRVSVEDGQRERIKFWVTLVGFWLIGFR